MRLGTAGRLALGAMGVTTALTSAFVGAASVLASRRITQPAAFTFNVPPPPELPREPVTFTSRDGTPLAAWYIPAAGREPILLLHGYGATKREMLHHAAFLHEGGYPVLLLDLRCCGESGGAAVTFGGREREDVAAAIEHLQARPELDGERIGVLGLSLGGALALLAAADSAAVRAVVAEASFASIRSAVRRNWRVATRLPHFPFAHLTIWLVERRWGIRAKRVAPAREIGGREDCAVLLIHAENDEVVSVQDAHALFSAARGPKELWLLPNAGHAMAFLTLREAYADRVRAFFDRWLRGEEAAAEAGAVLVEAAG
jgi:uncharacterized protein